VRFVPGFSFLNWSAAVRPTGACIGRESRVVAGWIFKGCFVRGSVRDVEDILLREAMAGVVAVRRIQGEASVSRVAK
jgi:hypothetical protein